MSKARNYCFTIHECPNINWEEVYQEHAQGIKYLVVQREVCPETKRQHWQGYVELKVPKTIPQWQSWVDCGKAFHCEARKGTAQEAAKYCKKDDTRMPDTVPFEFGTISKQGERSDLSTVASMVIEGKTMKEIALASPATFVRYHKGLGALQSITREKTKRQMDIWIFTGPSGIGKTTWANWKWPGAWMATDSAPFWADGYQGEDTIIFEEFSGATPLTSILLPLLDGTLQQLPSKGAFVPLMATRVVFLSNMYWAQWYPDPHGALRRRVDQFCSRKGQLFEPELETPMPLDVGRALMETYPPSLAMTPRVTYEDEPGFYDFNPVLLEDENL